MSENEKALVLTVVAILILFFAIVIPQSYNIEKLQKKLNDCYYGTTCNLPE